MAVVRSWHISGTFTVSAVGEPVLHRNGGPVFEADSAMALTALGPTVGPTPVLALRTLSLVGRTGPYRWHVSDLASMHGVTPNVMRHALDRLARFDWLNDDGAGRVTVRLRGNLSVHQIERLHPAIVRHYLGRPAASSTPVGGEGRFPLDPLLSRAGASNLSQLARMLGVSRTAVQAASSRGLSERTADRYAIARRSPPGRGLARVGEPVSTSTDDHVCLATVAVGPRPCVERVISVNDSERSRLDHPASPGSADPGTPGTVGGAVHADQPTMIVAATDEPGTLSRSIAAVIDVS